MISACKSKQLYYLVLLTPYAEYSILPEDNPIQKFSKSVVRSMGKRVKD